MISSGTIHSFTFNMAGCKHYLLIYNVLQAIGWAYVLHAGFPLTQTTKDIWNNVRPSLLFFQTAAVLEIVHSIVKFVSSNPILTAFQVTSRLFTIWCVLEISPPSQASIGLPILIIAWCITEITRYTYYAVHLVGNSEWIAWCRYSFFIVLYPVGALGEGLCWFQSLDYIREKQLFTIKFPNPLNFTFDYYTFLIVVVLMYTPVFPILYMHMLKQRRKVLYPITNQRKFI